MLTGVRFSENEIGVMGYDGGKEEFFHYFHRRIEAAFHGTGDIFSSTAVGALMRGFSLEKALADLPRRERSVLTGSLHMCGEALEILQRG